MRGEQPGDAAARPARATAGSASSSSGSTGESIDERLLAARARRVQVVCQIPLTHDDDVGVERDDPHALEAPSSFAASRRFLTSAVGFFWLGSSFSLWRLTQITGIFSFDARLDVVVVAGRDVDPALLAADAALALLEVRGVGLVGAHLLRGDDEVEVDRDVAAGLAEQLVVDVRDQPDLELLARSFSSCALVSLNGGQRWTESGRKPEREGSSGQPSSLGDLARRCGAGPRRRARRSRPRSPAGSRGRAG